MMNEPIQRCFVIHGRVQGVGFRWWTRREAGRVGVGGTVRNRADGAVEVALSGPRDRVEAMRSRLGEGPRGARVERIDEVECIGEPAGETFRILR